MILPIVGYGDPVLRKVAREIRKDHAGLDRFITDMFETMYNASGVGLAAPQVGKDIRLFVVDASVYAEDDEADDGLTTDEERRKLAGFKRVFINAVMLSEEGEEWPFNEGCLSIPKIREDVHRLPKIVLQYHDENFKKQEEEFDGLAARIIQHEYDHIEGKLFTDRISPLRRRMIKGRLDDIIKGKVQVDYKMKFANAR
ncbi:MAG: peptide deformylase [Bacteroidia bacterium]|nr:peptide deformylase [Bacteroidia bacterium]